MQPVAAALALVLAAVSQRREAGRRRRAGGVSTGVRASVPGGRRHLGIGGVGSERGVGKRVIEIWLHARFIYVYVNVPAIDLDERADGRVGGLLAIIRLSASQEITRRRRALMYNSSQHQSLDAGPPSSPPTLMSA